MLEFLPFMGLALFLGLKHSYDADHLLAVGAFLRKAQSLKSAINMSLSWAIGHMITASLITLVLYFFRESVLSVVLANFEMIVGIMLIILGFFSINDAFMIHKHGHENVISSHEHPHLHVKNQEDEHIHNHIFGIGIHSKMLGVGIIHGLASNDELLILLTATLGVATLLGMFTGIAIFSIGVSFGMVLFAILFSYPFVKLHSEKFYKAISFSVGTLSIVYGILSLAPLL